MHIAGLQLASILCRNWVVLLLRGLIAIAFGVLTWFQPGVSRTLLYLFGAYALVDGTLGIGIAIGERTGHEYWWVLFFWGLAGAGVGVMTFLVPGVSPQVLLFYISVWAIATGICETVTAIRLRREIDGEWLLFLGGLASVVFGGLLMANPNAGGHALLWLITAYAIGFGVLLVILAFRTRAFRS
jgi:uncharacterized membrane protein HdeD (DUF308 family)